MIHSSWSSPSPQHAIKKKRQQVRYISFLQAATTEHRIVGVPGGSSPFFPVRVAHTIARYFAILLVHILGLSLMESRFSQAPDFQPRILLSIFPFPFSRLCLLDACPWVGSDFRFYLFSLPFMPCIILPSSACDSPSLIFGIPLSLRSFHLSATVDGGTVAHFPGCFIHFASLGSLWRGLKTTTPSSFYFTLPSTAAEPPHTSLPFAFNLPACIFDLAAASSLLPTTPYFWI